MTIFFGWVAPRRFGTVLSGRETAERYAPTGATPAIMRDGGIERAEWDGVRLVLQIGTGHVIPNRTTSPARMIIGPSHREPDLGEEIQDFFDL